MSAKAGDSFMIEDAANADGIIEGRRQEALLKTGALQTAILTSANFSSIATDAKGVIQIFNVGAERMRIHNTLEVRLLHRRLENYNEELDQAVRERTAELRESESHYRGLAELTSDWHWEKDAAGKFTKVSGPVV
jgi:hypothetical protein